MNIQASPATAGAAAADAEVRLRANIAGAEASVPIRNAIDWLDRVLA
jgi:hypothetical protein